MAIDTLQQTSARPSRQPSLAEARALFHRIRQFSAKLCEPLEAEDCVVQSMPDVSPIKWHLAHTTWFFETFVLKPHLRGWRSPNHAYEYLFNSYYNTIGRQFPRPQRGLLSRPTVAEVWEYRDVVDEAIERLLDSVPEELWNREIAVLFQVGLQHEQQHQELMLTDIKHVFSCNPICPRYAPASGRVESAAGDTAADYLAFEGGVCDIGHTGDGFAYDNEGPSHQQLVPRFSLAQRLVTAGEYLRFMSDGGYRRPEFWLSDGWNAVQANGWKAPLYWSERAGAWQEFTLEGLRPVDLDCPVTHVSFYEADAYCRWAGARLPTEFQWEVAAASVSLQETTADERRVHPAPSSDKTQPGQLGQMFGIVWQWTSSPYVGYPGYAPPTGAIGEYNGKFMCNQFVLRGGSVATPPNHIRKTYRNFFPADARWQFTGIRLAK